MNTLTSECRVVVQKVAAGLGANITMPMYTQDSRPIIGDSKPQYAVVDVKPDYTDVLAVASSARGMGASIAVIMAISLLSL
jgi:hypothetical protein